MTRDPRFDVLSEPVPIGVGDCLVPRALILAV